MRARSTPAAPTTPLRRPRATPATSSEAGPGATIDFVDRDTAQGEYTRFVLRLAPDGVSLREAPSGDYDPNSYLELGSLGDELVSLAAEIDYDSIDSVTVSGTGRSAISTIVLFASPGTGPFVRGDCQPNGAVELTDGVNLLNFLFLGGQRPPCMAACDFNATGELDITTAVFLFNFLFLGGEGRRRPATARHSPRPRATTSSVAWSTTRNGRSIRRLRFELKPPPGPTSPRRLFLCGRALQWLP